MLEYIKCKPRWRPSKSASKFSADTEDVLAFKQIYLSKAAAAYRNMLAKKVDDAYMSRMEDMKEEKAARERLLLMNSYTPPGPFDHIFKINDISPDQIPGFFSSTIAGIDESTSSRQSAAGGVRDSFATMKMWGGRGRLTPLVLQHGEPSLELIKQRIVQRRSMNIFLKNPNVASNLTKIGVSNFVNEDQHAPSVIQAPVATFPCVGNPVGACVGNPVGEATAYNQNNAKSKQ